MSKKVKEIRISNVIAQHFNNVFCDIFDHAYTHYWIDGGRGSTKSSFIGLAIVLLMKLNDNVNACILRKVGATLKDSVYNQILWAIDTLCLTKEFKATVSPLEITRIKTGQKIYFRGADDPVKIKSIKPKKGYIGVTWFEELDQFYGMEEIRNMLQSMNRGGDKYWNFYSFNPPKSKDNWVNVEKWEESDDKIAHHSNYLGVPREWLGEQFFTEADKLKEKKPQAYEHEYLGIATGTGGAIFENLIEREITEGEINNLSYFYYGVDFGFALDEFAFSKIAHDKKNNKIYILDEIYEQKLTNKKAVEKIKAKGITNQLITADSSEPKSIFEMQELGLKVYKAKKGPDSVEHGIKWLQSLDAIVVDRKRTPNAFKEFSLYEYELDRNGNYISRYPDKNNHYIDSVRYAMESIINERKVRFI